MYRSLPPIGELKQDDTIPEWWVSEPVAIPFLSGQEIPFTITLDAEGDQYPSDVSEAVTAFLNLTRGDLDAASFKVFKNYQDFVDAVSDLDFEIAMPADVWNHVEFREIYIDRRHRWDRDVHVKVACECDWEMEHGLQLVFQQGSKLVRVSAQDGHLRHADACGLPKDEDV